jgi:hypothetical protein
LLHTVFDGLIIIVKSSSSSSSYDKITEFYTEWFSVYPNITSKFRAIAIFKNCVKQNNDSNKTYRYVRDLFFSKVHLAKCNGSWVFSIKHTMNFKHSNGRHVRIFCFLTKMASLKVVHPLKIYQFSKFHGPMLTGASSASTSEVWTSAILEWLKVRD